MKEFNEMISNKTIGKKIYSRRKTLGFSGKELGKKMGLSQQQISRYERGTQNFTISKLCEFANILECELHYFTKKIQ